MPRNWRQRREVSDQCCVQTTFKQQQKKAGRWHNSKKKEKRRISKWVNWHKKKSRQDKIIDCGHNLHIIGIGNFAIFAVQFFPQERTVENSISTRCPRQNDRMGQTVNSCFVETNTFQIGLPLKSRCSAYSGPFAFYRSDEIILHEVRFLYVQ